MKLLYFAAVEPGGLSDYVVHQAIALSEEGVDITVLGYQYIGSQLNEKSANVRFVELPPAHKSGNRWGRAIQTVLRRRKHVSQLAKMVVDERFSHVLISSYSEYFAPFWVWPLRRLARKGIWFGAVIHDPIRDFVLGPRWWHRWSVRLACSFCRDVFVHHMGTVSDRYWPEGCELTEIVHGPYSITGNNSETRNKSIARGKINLSDDCVVFLSFGHIRDGKNLDIVIRAMENVPNAHLLVVGKEQSSSQRPISFYQRLAEQCGVANRCSWIHGFIPNDEIPNYFAAADILLLTYSECFRSASGVLALASQFRIPVIASGGDGALKRDVQAYGLGSWVTPDNVTELANGMIRFVELLTSAPKLNTPWDAFNQVHTWKSNVSTTISRMQQSTQCLTNL